MPDRRACSRPWPGPPEPRSVGIPVLGALVWGAAILLPAAAAMADEWSLKGKVDATGTFDDNIRLRAENEQSVWGAIFAPRLDVQGRGQVWELTTSVDLAIARYTEDSALDRNDVRLLFDGGYRTQLGRWGLAGEASRISTLITETTDFGNLDTNADRDLVSLAPSWSYELTERDTVALTGRWTEADFDTDVLADYRNLVASAGWTRQVTQVDAVTLTGFASRFESDQAVELTSDLVGGLVGWDHAFSERLQTSIAAGPQYFSTESPVVSGTSIGTEEDSAFGYRLNASVKYMLDDRTTLTSSFLHEIQPTSGGTPLQRNIFRGSVLHEFLPVLTAELEGYVQFDSDPVDTAAAGRDREFFRVEPRITWDFAAEWALSARYRFRTQETSDGSRAFSNAVFFSLTYRPLKETFGH